MSGETLALAYLSLAKWFTYIGFFGLIGAVAVRLVVVPGSCRRGMIVSELVPTIDRQIYRIALFSAVLLLCAVTARLYAQTYAVFGLDEPITLALLKLVALETRWGAQWFPQLWAVFFAIGVAVLMPVWPRAGWWSMAVATAALAFTLPMTGHAMSHSGGAGLPWTLQVGHGVAGGLWLGTLATVVATVRSSRIKTVDADGHLTAALVNGFSPLAVVAVGTVLVTGVATATLYLDSWSQLWQTSYGRVLLTKVVLMLVTGAVGAYNWRFLRPRMGNARGITALITSARLELVIACLVLFFTAILVHMPMPE